MPALHSGSLDSQPANAFLSLVEVNLKEKIIIFGEIIKTILKSPSDSVQKWGSLQHPYIGIGKSEALKYELAGYWSRRINPEHRIVYRVIDDMVEIEVLAMRYHYGK